MAVLKNLISIGSLSGDDENVALRKQFVIIQGLGMSFGGIVWGTLLIIFGYPKPSIIPYGYVVGTIINLFFFNKYKNFTIARNFQTVISMFLPFMMMPVVFQKDWQR